MECLDEESQVCGLCGVIPEAVLGEIYILLLMVILKFLITLAGDGGEDVSCVLESWHLERSDTDRGGGSFQLVIQTRSSIISNVFLLRLWCIQEYTWGEGLDLF